ncbi:hydroxypyruvate isomerase [Achromobacter spanius]|uniref:Hydroxypyruvate isomerase n=1 Tax=Achromobacter spanius TaxID=217203 RepID=A0A2S5GXW7_9BURK|nr:MULTISPECIES: 2-oxo-tetronate isomerase [Achromobacter]PPA77651.1 hydroxypyruvate isomerase [Achromobacter spanius]QYJ21219.1 hydroxypyruvate isomerase family protein [Achromobacter sp. ES-001]
MLKFAANLSMMYQEYPFLDRYAAAASDGFTGVECMFPYAEPAAFVRERMDAVGVSQVLFNAPPGVTSRGERGLAALPGRQAEFQAGIEHALSYATTLSCSNVHVMAGLAPDGVPRESLLDCYRENLDWAARQARSAGVTLLIEPINTRDIPGYILNRQSEAHAIVQAVNASNLKVQMDLYHCQIVEGDVTTKLHEYLPTGRVGHVQIAGVPHRHEPDRGELDYGWVFNVLRELDYSGWIGCEYRPAGHTSAGLRWLNAARG